MSKVVDTTLYDRLGVKPDADVDDIKKAFRKLALKHHPDKWANATDKEKKEAEETFKKLTEASAILSDPDKRKKYDRYGMDALKEGGFGATDEDIQAMFEKMGGFPFDDIMGGIFGNGMGGMRGMHGMGRGKRQEPKMPVSTKIIEVNMKDIYTGSPVEIEIERYDLKKNEKPKSEELVCDDCKGEGTKVQLTQLRPGMFTQSNQTCNKCKGEGIFIDKFFERKTHKMTYNIPKGVMGRQKNIIIEDEGHEIPECFKKSYPDKKRTDVTIVISEDPTYEVNGFKYSRGVFDNPFNVALEISIEPHEAICGTYKNITFINDKNICIEIPKGIIFKRSSQPVVVIPKMGLPVYNQKGKYGELYVILNVNEQKLEDAKLKQIWKVYTGKDMTAEHNKILKKNNDEYIESMSLDEFKKSNHNSHSHDRDGDGDGDDDDDNHEGPQCRQQ